MWTIRKAAVADAPRLAEIHVFGWRSAYRGIVPDSYLFGKLSVGKRTDGFRKALEDGVEETYVYEEEGLIEAFMTIGKCRNQDKADSFELRGIYVEPLMRGGGIGTRMVAFCEEAARSRGHKENVLWVFRDNAASRGFYEKRGYEPDGKEETIERFDAVEMRYAKPIG